MIKEQIVRIETDGNETKAEVIGELVRCKYCIYWEQDVIFEDGWCRGKHQGDPYWFCADGERKEGVAE